MNNFEIVANQYAQLHQQMCSALETADGLGKFAIKPWEKDIGHGTTCVLEKGAVIEKGAINYSKVSGKYTLQMEALLGGKASHFAATGISSIVHPTNPWVPIIHMNIRYFALDNGTTWFGGGIDLTPHIIIPEDAQTFHKKLKEICDRFNPNYYSEFKNWADNYFFLPHRNETRGIGGIFFDRIQPKNNFEQIFEFTKALGETYPQLYAQLMRKYGRHEFTDREKNWQLLRRGRYVEFNLIYDRGTKFGLESGGNTESILTSLPETAKWFYDYHPSETGFEKDTLDLLKKNIDWINFKADTILGS